VAKALITPRVGDGSRSITDRRYRGGPDRTPEQNTDALRRMWADLYNEKGCGRLPPGPIEVLSDPTLVPREDTSIVGYEGRTILRNSNFADSPIFDVEGVNSFGIAGVVLDGQNSEDAPGASSCIVIHGCSGFNLEAALVNAGNNGAVVRGPNVTKFRVVARGCKNIGHEGQLGGGHAVALTGDGVGTPFDCTHGYVWMDGVDIRNGGINVGSSYKIEVHGRVVNSTSIVSGYAVVRIANGSASIRGTVHGVRVGRVLRIGPSNDIYFYDVYGEESYAEGVLIAGGVYLDGWRGRNAYVAGTLLDCNIGAGGTPCRVKSYENVQLRLEYRNRPGFSALRGATVTTSDEDLTESQVRKVLRIRSTNANLVDPYRWAVTPNVADPTKMDLTAINDDAIGATFATVTAANKTNVAAASAIATIPGTPFTAEVVGATAELEVSTAARHGSADHGLMVADIGAYLAAPVSAITGTDHWTMRDASAMVASPNGRTHFPFDGVIYDPANPGPQERVLITAEASNVLTVLRAQKGTAARAWPQDALLFGHPSTVDVLAGTGSRMSDDTINVVGPGLVTVNTKSLRTDGPTSRGSATALILPPEIDTYDITGTQDVVWFLNGGPKREVTLIAKSTAWRVKHGTGNALCKGQVDYVPPYLEAVSRWQWDNIGNIVRQVA
jgi:hypothetical protein